MAATPARAGGRGGGGEGVEKLGRGDRGGGATERGVYKRVYPPRKGGEHAGETSSSLLLGTFLSVTKEGVASLMCR